MNVKSVGMRLLVTGTAAFSAFALSSVSASAEVLPAPIPAPVPGSLPTPDLPELGLPGGTDGRVPATGTPLDDLPGSALPLDDLSPQAPGKVSMPLEAELPGDVTTPNHLAHRLPSMEGSLPVEGQFSEIASLADPSSILRSLVPVSLLG